jgi:hypothetical protein
VTSTPISGRLFQIFAPAPGSDPYDAAGEYQSFGSPAPATTGINPASSPAVGQPLTGTAFPLQQSVIVYSPTGLSPDSEANNAGATLSVVDGTAKQFRLTIPSLSVNTIFTSPTLLQNATQISSSSLHLAVSNLSYTIFGAWEVDQSVTASRIPYDFRAHVGAFVSGYETPASAMPQSGTAAYSGTGNVAGLLLEYLSDGGITKLPIQGDAAFTANFGTGAVIGNFKNMVAGTTPWNDISVSAAIAAGSSRFSGTITAAPVAQPVAPSYVGRIQLSGSSKGNIDGSFYGPSANELGAVWSIKDGSIATMNGSITAIGIVSGH